MANATDWVPDVQLKLTGDLPPLSPRDHQVAAWGAMSRHYLEAERQAAIVVMPTGGGKTFTAAHWLLEHHVRAGGRVLWFAHRRSLLRQAFRAFRALGNVASPRDRLGLIAISSLDSHWSMVTGQHDVVFSSMQSAVLQDNMPSVEVFLDDSPRGVFVVVDEAHHAPAPGYARLLRRLKERGCRLLGLTATPVRGDEDDQKRLSALFDDSIVYQVSRQRLIEANVLAVPSFETVKTQVEMEQEFTPEDYRHLERFGEIGPAVLERLARNAPRNQLIVEHYAHHKDRFGPTIVFAADTMHCMTLTEEFRKAGVNADYVTYNRSDAQAVISRYQEGKGPDVLVNVEMLTEGFDAPHTRTVFIARPTRSEVLLTQMVGRALRGTKANGNPMAYLVTFIDTWSQFNVLDPEYVLADGQDVPVELPPSKPARRVSIPPELIHEAYRLIRSAFRGHFEGVYQCLPHGWFIWWETVEDDEHQRTVMVFENQVAGFELLLADAGDPGLIPDDLSEDAVRGLVQRYFSDVPDPLPRWTDVKALLEARRRGCEVHHYTFDQKRRFDPQVLAAQIVEQELSPTAMRSRLETIWDENAACSCVYRGDFHEFLADVSREVTLRVCPPNPPRELEIVPYVPTTPPRSWTEGRPGYDLAAIRDAVLGVEPHFPKGAPRHAGPRWMNAVSQRYFGFCRYSDGSISVNPVLNSPDVPLFVLEFVLYHELLHAELPYAGHNADFKARERRFQPSHQAVVKALESGIKPVESPGTWRARAYTFLHTFQTRWLLADPGTGYPL